MADKRADQLKEITERLEQGVKDIFTSEMYPALPGKSAGAESNFGYENAFGKAAGKQGVRGTPQHPAVCS